MSIWPDKWWPSGKHQLTSWECEEAVARQCNALNSQWKFTSLSSQHTSCHSSASNPLRAKAANDKSPTIAIPIITVLHQSSGSRGVHEVMNEWPDGTGEQAPPPGETALWSPCLAGSFERIAVAKPPLVKEITIQLPKCKSPEVQGALEPTKDDKNNEEQQVD